MQPPGCGPPRAPPLSPSEGTQAPSPPLRGRAEGSLRTPVHSPFPGTPSAHPGGGRGEQAPVHCPLGVPSFPEPALGPVPSLSTGVGPGAGVAAPLGMLTFEDRDVDGGPQAGQLCPRVPVAHVGARAGGGGGPGWTAALHARPAGQPQATPGPSRQCQEQQEGRGHHSGQGLGPGRKWGGGWERKAGSGGLALLSPQFPPRQPGSAPVWGRRWRAQRATWVGRDSWDPSKGLWSQRPQRAPGQPLLDSHPALTLLMGPSPGLRLLPDTAWGPPLLGGPCTALPEP